MAVRQKESVEKIKLYIPAKTIESVIRKYGLREEDIIKLAGNESRYGASPKVGDALKKHENEYSFYPDVNGTRLKELLSRKFDIGTEHFALGNGSFELISDLADAYLDKGDEAIYADPSFGWYVSATVKNGAIPIKVPVNTDQELNPEGILNAITSKTKIIWICNPNNPTGTVISPKRLTDLIQQIPSNILIVLDEAYIDFIDGDYINTVNFVKETSNVVLLRTFSKAYGLAGFRIGYAIGPVDVIAGITKVKLPINTSFPAQLAAQEALQDQDFHDYVVSEIKKGREQYYEAFQEFGWKYIRSNGNFIFVHTGIDSAFLEEQLIRHGILIRKGSDFGEDYRYWLRISIGRYEENRKVIDALRKILSENQYKDYLEPGRRG